MAMATLGQIDNGRATLPHVSPDYTRLCLEIEPGVTPVTGRLTGRRGTWTVFAGWAQLIRAIEQAADVHLDSPDSNTKRRNP
jgi:hypothetical protein